MSHPTGSFLPTAVCTLRVEFGATWSRAWPGLRWEALACLWHLSLAPAPNASASPAQLFTQRSPGHALGGGYLGIQPGSAPGPDLWIARGLTTLAL